ncbi:hypothetical protein FOA52_008576 [Chlamydomonas sp. UWO 241]|nr:hypothetical protein FOA52_008576 [Chlamydomonas sp. UWO 241]
MARLLLVGLVAALLLAADVTAVTLVKGDSKPFTSSVKPSEECPSLRIAIINGVSFHFEILAGLLHVLQPYEKYVDVYMSPWIRRENYDGAWDLVRWSKANFRSMSEKIADKKLRYDLVVLVSPDYELEQNKLLLEQMRPALTVAIVHNADFGNMTRLLGLSDPLELLTLSPHVAASLAAATQRPTDWILPVYPVRPEPDCTRETGAGSIVGMCLRGFAMQGKFSNLRRNYTSVWAQMGSRLEQLNDPQIGKVFHMNVLGKGPDRLNLPDVLTPHVTVHRRLPFGAFYNVICHNLALVPSLANAKYFTHKFSSTVITSLSTGTPMITNDRMLDAYTFLEKDAMFYQAAGEPEIDAMLRISASPDASILATRKALKQLRYKLNDRAFGMLEAYIRRVCKPE